MLAGTSWSMHCLCLPLGLFDVSMLTSHLPQGQIAFSLLLGSWLFHRLDRLCSFRHVLLPRICWTQYISRPLNTAITIIWRGLLHCIVVCVMGFLTPPFSGLSLSMNIVLPKALLVSKLLLVSSRYFFLILQKEIYALGRLYLGSQRNYVSLSHKLPTLCGQ